MVFSGICELTRHNTYKKNFKQMKFGDSVDSEKDLPMQRPNTEQHAMSDPKLSHHGNTKLTTDAVNNATI